MEFDREAPYNPSQLEQGKAQFQKGEHEPSGKQWQYLPLTLPILGAFAAVVAMELARHKHLSDEKTASEMQVFEKVDVVKKYGLHPVNVPRKTDDQIKIEAKEYVASHIIDGKALGIQRSPAEAYDSDKYLDSLRLLYTEEEISSALRFLHNGGENNSAPQVIGSQKFNGINNDKPTLGAK